MKKKLLFYVITLISTACFVLLQLFDPSIIKEHIESKTFDFRLLLRNLVKKQEISADIIIVAIDEKSIKEIGRFPWRRDIEASMVRRISAGKPKVIGIDIMFTEPETAETDKELADSIKEARNVVLATPFFVPTGKKKEVVAGELPDFLWDAAFMNVKSEKGIKWKDYSIKAESVNPPLEEFATSATLGHVYTQPDLDGVTRWEVIYLNYGDDCYPSLATQIARIALGVEPKDVVLFGGTGVKLGARFIATDLSGRVKINYVGKERSFPYFSASDVINGSIDPNSFRDKIVLIGTSALATYDQKITPFSADMPGVEKNANVVSNIIQNNFLVPSPGVVESSVILITGILLGFILTKLKALPGAAIAAGFVAVYVLGSLYLLIYHNFVLALIYPVSNMLSIFSVQTIVRFFHEERKAREIRLMFSSYVSPKIVHQLIEHPEKAKLGGERREVTILFSDVIGFTSLSERKRPEEVVTLLNEYLSEMTDIIFRWDGTLDKFVGDEIMAFWGAPIEQPNHAELAVRCALEMSARLDSLQEDWRARGEDIIDCGMGINTGEAIIGNIGAEGKKMDYTLIGDHVNLTARVEKLTRNYGTRILITDNTYNHIISVVKGGSFRGCEITDLDTVNVKGKEKGVRIMSVKGVKPEK